MRNIFLIMCFISLISCSKTDYKEKFSNLEKKNFSDFTGYSITYRNGSYLISIVISTFLIYLFGRKLFDKNAIFSIDNIGISDKVNILDYPFIKWKDITRIEESKVNNVSHLKIFIHNPKQYINQKKGFKKWVLSFNYKQYQTPILLNCTYLSCSFNMFKENILDLYEEYK